MQTVLIRLAHEYCRSIDVSNTTRPTSVVHTSFELASATTALCIGDYVYMAPDCFFANVNLTYV